MVIIAQCLDTVHTHTLWVQEKNSCVINSTGVLACEKIKAILQPKYNKIKEKKIWKYFTENCNLLPCLFCVFFCKKLLQKKML